MCVNPYLLLLLHLASWRCASAGIPTPSSYVPTSKIKQTPNTIVQVFPSTTLSSTVVSTNDDFQKITADAPLNVPASIIDQISSTVVQASPGFKPVLPPIFPPFQIPKASVNWLPQTTVAFSDVCPNRTDSFFGIDYFWPETESGMFVFLPCPPGFIGLVKRKCSNFGVWVPLVFSQFNCVAKGAVQGLQSQAQTFFKGNNPDAEGALFLINQLSNLTMPPPVKNKPFLSNNDLSTINFVTGEALQVLRRQGSRDQAEDILDLLNNALDSRNKDSWFSLQDSQSGSEELLNNAESYGLYLGGILNASNTVTQFSRENLAIRANRLGRGDTFSDSIFPKSSDLVNSSTSDTTSNIKIPSAYLKALATTDESDVTVVSMLFTTLQEFLPDDQLLENQTLASVIISSQVFTDSADSSFRSEFESVLEENPIELTFTLNISYNILEENVTVNCVYWNFTMDFNSSSSGSWVSDGITAELIDNSTVRCLSKHLTSFSVLVDVTSSTEDNENVTTINPTIEERLLSVVSYIGCSVSIVCLSITIICLLSFGKSLLSEVYNFIHLCLSTSLLIALIIFVAGIKFGSSIMPLCKTITALLHYFFLSAFCWMLCEALMLFLLIVLVFSTLTKKWWVYCIIGWGLPVIPVAITLGIGFNNYTPIGICWLNNANFLIWGFVGPMLIIILMNAIVLVIVLIKVVQTKKTKKVGGSLTEARDTAAHLIKGAVVLLPLLGLTWIFGVFAIDSNTTVFAWIFTVLNSLQGVFIFVFHVLGSRKFIKKVQSWYRRKQKRKRAQSELFSRTQTTSFSSKLSTTVIEVKKDLTGL